ncbi:Asparagine synthetase (glutamine-hydrolyzing) [Candidatus Nitrotoga sp. BS]|uniref:asparagine synthetase B family protein n=1 Tax=Candidatus Nitrotoga sp. BS TaxID=2890408 RepID=UPI001EF29B21|nr:asparagine synthase C-terminal domain-containing protein [Candidatus Nitrotoga sp. BS]CAH1202340.1 Asparagine synthetase (glutamine-hydrolyzing) [Candidatus Nitrotoga sp. BS]
MKGMCGWIGGERDPLLAKQITDAMVHAMTDEKGDTMLPRYSRCEGIAAWSKIDQASCHEVGSLKVAVVGNVYWENAELNELAQKESPAAAVAKAYSRSGRAFLEDMHGTFCVAVFNSQDGTVIAAIDRLGIYSICYAAPCGHFIFATSTDGVVAHPDMERVIDPQSIFNYLFFHAVPAPGSIYKNVRKLLPGQYALYQNGKVETNFYWHLKYADSGQSHFIQRQETLKKLLQTALRRSVTDEQVGAFLSGGTDSSTIAGVLAQSSTKTAHTFSIGFAAEGYDEMEFARITSKHFGTHAHEYYVTAQDVVETIPLIARAYDEPFGNASAVPTYCCAKLAKEQGIRLMLAGDGGDEIFGGNARYAKQKIFEAYSLIPAMLRHSILEPAMFGVPCIERIPLLRKLKSYIAQARVPLPGRLETYNFLHRTSPNEIFTADFLAQVNNQEPDELLQTEYGRTDSTSSTNRLLNLDLKFTLADNDLRKVNRMCELAGVAVHYPLLDEDIVEFAAQLPPSLKVKGLKLRYFFKEALKDFLPQETLTKSKQGFGLPFGVWMQTYLPLQELTYDSLKSLRGRGYIRPEYIDTLIEQHRSGHAAYYGVMIWVLMMLEQWLQHHEK